MPKLRFVSRINHLLHTARLIWLCPALIVIVLLGFNRHIGLAAWLVAFFALERTWKQHPLSGTEYLGFAITLSTLAAGQSLLSYSAILSALLFSLGLGLGLPLWRQKPWSDILEHTGLAIERGWNGLADSIKAQFDPARHEREDELEEDEPGFDDDYDDEPHLPVSKITQASTDFRNRITVPVPEAAPAPQAETVRTAPADIIPPRATVRPVFNPAQREEPVAAKPVVAAPVEVPAPRPVVNAETIQLNSQPPIHRTELFQHFQTPAAPEAPAAKPLPLIDLGQIRQHLQNDHRVKSHIARPRPAEPTALPMIETEEIRQRLASIHGHTTAPAPFPPRSAPVKKAPPVSTPMITSSPRLFQLEPRPTPAAPRIEPVLNETTIKDLAIVLPEPVAAAPEMPAPATEAPVSLASMLVWEAAESITLQPVFDHEEKIEPFVPPLAPLIGEIDFSAAPAVPAAPMVRITSLTPPPAQVVRQPPAQVESPVLVAEPVVSEAKAFEPAVEELPVVAPAVEAFTPAPFEVTPAEPELTWSKPPVPAPLPPAVPFHYSDDFMPSLSLLHAPEPLIQTISQDDLLDRGILIEEKLAEFRVKASVLDAYAGPVITRYEIEPAIGVRGAQIVNLMKDLARALGLVSIRVVETIPGKTCMGLELPNPTRQMIRLSEILSSDVYLNNPSKLTIALGKDITGAPVVTDLAKAPHMLVAGTTGSGKSVGVNAMILSLLYKATPEEVRFIMVDPKMLELSVYDGIPHLLAPVVTDMKLAANALNWCVAEMEKRYRLLSTFGVRNLAGFNQKIREAEQRGERLVNPFSLTPDEPEALEHLPFIVVVVDEFADLMMVAGKKIEELIARLAQKARAAGIHLILATQRPSVDVITGLIKANIPTRLAFQVSSKIDSRTILDQMGAEALLGQGDMLFLPPGTGYPQRIHGAFVDDNEVHRVVEHLKQFGEPNYIEGVLNGGFDAEASASGSSNNNDNGEADPIYDEAVALVLKSRRASISAVQRQLRIGYNRAARLIDQMEAAGIVSGMESNGNRTVLAPPAME